MIKEWGEFSPEGWRKLAGRPGRVSGRSPRINRQKNRALKGRWNAKTFPAYSIAHSGQGSIGRVFPWEAPALQNCLPVFCTQKLSQIKVN